MGPRAPRKSAAQKKKDTQQQKVRGDLADASSPSPNLEIPEFGRSQVGSKAYLDESLPPMHELEEIFKDLSEKALSLGFAAVIDCLAGRPLRVATVCSGTESPLLALEMIQKVMPAGQPFRISHLFSCEIVPFKQAYIERTFGPKVIFRDLTELGEDVARTAYGSLVPVPGELDIMIAGTACVDFSPLNSKQKDIEGGGESGKTFEALLEYGRKYRPRIVIMENVRAAPWKEFAEAWSGIGYDAFHSIVDSKNYYIPQTRIRGYMVCVDNKRRSENAGKESFGADWVALVKAMKRQASSPAGTFLLEEDDHRLEQISKDSVHAWSAPRGEVEWARYQERHKQHRSCKEVGDRRPISRSLPGGTISMPPDFFWPHFFKAQVERVWETLDIKFLVGLLKGVDMNFKERWVDVSQGVDRGVESEKNFGVAGCLTPNGVPFMSTRGGPLCGLEALALQGLPIDRMILTETPKQLQDLAGNAMTSTVVCAVIMAALIIFQDVLKEVPETEAEAEVQQTRLLALKGGDNLLPIPKSQNSGPLSLDAIIAVAARTVCYCQCEKQSENKKDLVKCTQCGQTACIACAGNPTHSYKELELKVRRTNPSDFKNLLKKVLPKRLELEGLSVGAFQEYRSLFPGDTEAQRSRAFDEFSAVVAAALSDKARFFEIRRGEGWTVMYEGDNSSLRLSITEKEIWWFVYGKPPPSSAARCLLREILKKPIARMAVARGSLLEGEWEVCAPISTGFCLSISGFGEQVRSYEAECGLVREDFVNSKVWTRIRVAADDKDVVSLDVDVRGDYQFLPDCGTALGSLYRKEATTTSPDVYLFLDPSKNGEVRLDSCVFSIGHSRVPGYVPRMTIAELSPSWRAAHVENTPASTTAFNRVWQKVATAYLRPIVCEEMVESCRVAHRNISVDESVCSQSYITLASLAAPATMLNLSQVASPWQALSSDIPTAMKDLSWAFQGVAAVAGSPHWMQIDWNRPMPSCQSPICGDCVPAPPDVIWRLSWKNTVVPIEDPKGAAAFERAIKTKPPAFMVFSHVDNDGLGELRFALNIQSMAHQAFGKLVDPKDPKISKDARFHWRLLSNVAELLRTKCQRMVIGGNNEDPCSAQPTMRLALRRDQLRSLAWMVTQESDDIKPFREEEIEEATLPLMSWRAEVRVSMPKTIRGGVLADDVGYGKTAIILGLIAAQRREDSRIVNKPSQRLDFITTGATLIIVPGHLFQQWKLEIVKFLGTGYKVITMSRMSSLDKATVKDFKAANIVLITWNLLNGEAYQKRIRLFTGSPEVPSSGERIFDNWFGNAERSLRDLVRILQEGGSEGSPEVFAQEALARYKQVLQDQADVTYCPSKRLRGKAFALAQQALQEAVDTGRSQMAVPLPDHGRPFERVRSASGSREASVFERAGSTLTRATSAGTREPSQLVEVQDDGADEMAIEDDGNSIDGDDELGPSESNTFGEEGGTTKGKKRKIGESKGKAPLSDKKKLELATADINKLLNIQPDMWKMKGLPIHAFSFARLVIDEYTYTKEEKQRSLVSLSARSKWVLSGTPATGEFADVKSIARYLGIHLGVDDDGNSPTENARLNQARKCLSGLEALQMFQVPRSQPWYEHRRDHAQGFLDTFARKNPAMIGHIKVTHHPILCKQFAEERKMYDALYSHLKSKHGQLRRKGNAHGDLQIERLNEFLSEREPNPSHAALLKCATVSNLRGFAWNVGKCQSKFEKQRTSLETSWEKVDSLTKQAVLAMRRWAVHLPVWSSFLENVFAAQIGDHEATVMARRRLTNLWTSYGRIENKDTSDINKKLAERFKNTKETKASRAAAEKAAAAAADVSGTDPDDIVTSVSGLRSSDLDEAAAHAAKRMKLSFPPTDNESMKSRGAKEQVVAKKLQSETIATLRKICEAVQQLRFLTAMLTLQTATEHCCEFCGRSFASMNDIVVLRSCGHTLCETCVGASNAKDKAYIEALKAVEQTTEEASDAEEQTGFQEASDGEEKYCIEAQGICPLDKCEGSTNLFKRIAGRTVNEETDDINRKLIRMISMIKDTPSDDQVLLFIQFEDLIGKANIALTSAGIDCIWARSAKDVAKFAPPDPGDAKRKQRRQKKDGEEETETQEEKPRLKVLILQLGEVVSSGLNLQCANHIFFLSPYNAPNWHQYQASMTQAIGRSVRYGQEKHVHIYHMLSMDTTDITVFQARNRGSIVYQGSKAFIADKEFLDQRPASISVLEGPSLNFGLGDNLDVPGSNSTRKDREDEEAINGIVEELVEEVVTAAAESAVGYVGQDSMYRNPPAWQYEIDNGDDMDLSE